MRLARALVAFLALFIPACGAGRWVERRQVVGPDGTYDYFLITCRMHTDCYKLVGRGCLFGHEVLRDTDTRGEGAILVHCTPKPLPASNPF